VNSKNSVASSRQPRRARSKVNYDARISAIVSERTQKMREIDSLRRENPDAGSFAVKAHTLLTRDWSKGSWHARENILQTVNWLLRMETRRRLASALAEADHIDRGMSFT
jgi:hypothetical protein